MTDSHRHSSRRYDIDALRVIAFGLLIIYHTGMFYVADWGWHIKSAYTVEWLQEPMRFMNQWRMSLLFVISGLALSFVWARYPTGKLLSRRLWRLGLPLLFGMAVVVAPQPYIEAVSNGVISTGFFEFWGKYLTFNDFPGEAWGGENLIVWTWNHLWYLAYLLLYTLLLPLIAAPLHGPLAPLHRGFLALRGWRIIVVPLLPLMVAGLVVFPAFPYVNHSLINDFYAHAMYGTLFLYGFMIGRHEPLWAELARLRYALLGTATLAYAALRLQDFWAGENAGTIVETLAIFNVYLNRWTWILTLLAFAFVHLNRPVRGLAYATAAIFPWYMLHQTITVVAGYVLAPAALGPVVEPALVFGLTVAGCYALYEFVIRRIRVLHPLFGVSLPPMADSKTRSQSAGGAPAA